MWRTTTFLLIAVVVAAAAGADSPIAPGEKPRDYGAVGAGEGPVSDAKGNVYFTSRGRITRRDVSGAISIFRDSMPGANGLIFDHEGRLIVCEAGNRRVVRIEPGGELTVLADSYESMKFNSPNDLSIDSKGRIYFSDPRYGNRDNMEMRDSAGKLVEGVYRIDAPGKVTRIIGREVERANGVLVSPRDEFLYVADNNNNTVGGARKLFRFRLRSDGTVDPGSRKLIFDWKDGRGPDGVKMDLQGRLYVAGGRNRASPPYETADKFTGGVYILSPQGKLLHFVPIPQDEVTNCAFAGPDWKTLFITAGGTLWSIRVNTPGWIPYLPSWRNETTLFSTKQ
jgi:gluconolactonase